MVHALSGGNPETDDSDYSVVNVVALSGNHRATVRSASHHRASVKLSLSVVKRCGAKRGDDDQTLSWRGQPGGLTTDSGQAP
jgi:hypothetical protein